MDLDQVLGRSLVNALPGADQRGRHGARLLVPHLGGVRGDALGGLGGLGGLSGLARSRRGRRGDRAGHRRLGIRRRVGG